MAGYVTNIDRDGQRLYETTPVLVQSTRAALDARRWLAGRQSEG